jgi:hypothetical protein
MLTGTKVGLIGSSNSLVGDPERAESHHSPFYYTLRFLNQAVQADELPGKKPPYFSFAQAYDIALATVALTAEVQFLGRVLHSEPHLLIVTPIYVAAVA